jgi:Kef-type K+ transport system membrane component KefB|tara:strand:- start:452 stop:808 length:357 start_codon:yes stop_codon:yes gene_type:complete
MNGAEVTLIPLFIILLLGLIIPELFKKLRVPYVTCLILLGAILGPNGVNYVQSNEAIELFGFLGMTFLMFMAGLETDIGKLKKLKSKLVTMSLLNGIIPFIVGVAITKLFGYSWLTSV